MSNDANFLEAQNDLSKTIQKQWQKNEGQKYEEWVSAKMPTVKQQEAVNIFLSYIFLS